MIDKTMVMELCNKYELGYNYFGDKVVISTGTDKWLIIGKLVGRYSDCEYNNLVFELRHENKKRNKSGKVHFHKQRTVYKLEHAFDTILEHKPKVYEYQKTLDLIKQLDLIKKSDNKSA